jgi:hypothetical protein
MTTWHVAVDGTTGNAGTVESPWSLNHARTGAGGLIVAGDTVIVQAGTYTSISGFNFTLSGTPDNPITFEASGSVIIDGAYPSPTWELHDAATNTYRTTATTYGVAKQGGHIQIGSKWYPLATHQTLADLMATTQVYNPTTNYYLGPGIAEDSSDGRIYIRLTPADPAVQYGRTCAIPGSLNPASVTLRLCGGQRYGIIATGDHLTFDGFTCNDYYSLFQAIGDGVTFRNISGRFIFIGFRTGGTIDGLTVDSCTFDGFMDPTDWWLAWLDCKGGRTIADEVRKAGCNIGGGSSNIEIVDCTFAGMFDGILAAIGPTHHVEVHGCTFSVWDDAWQMYSDLYEIDFHDNICLGAGPSHDASGDAEPNVAPGTIYVHHNIIDATALPILWGRVGSEPTGNAYGFGEPIAVSAHGGPERQVPWKIYHNTIITGPEQITQLLDVGLYGENNAFAGSTHDVFNNIIVTAGQMRLSATAYADSGHERWDGNCYWGWVTTSRMWSAVRPGGSLPRTLADLYTSAMFEASKATYAPGWEASGLAADPRLDTSYVPHTSSVMSGAVDLSTSGWPGTTPPQPCRGAIAATPASLDTVTRAGGVTRRFV